MQCQMDSFRLVKYKMSYGRASCRAPNMLLRKRHNAAPGMVVVSKTKKKKKITAGFAKRLQILLLPHALPGTTGWQQQHQQQQQAFPQGEEGIEWEDGG